MYDTLVNIYYKINPHIGILFPLSKWLFIITCSYIIMKKKEYKSNKKNRINILKFFRFLSILFIFYYLSLYIFFPYLTKLEIYEGIQYTILEFTNIISITGWIILIASLIDILLKTIKIDFLTKLTINKKNTESKIFISNFLIALCYIFTKYLFKLIFILFF